MLTKTEKYIKLFTFYRKSVLNTIEPFVNINRFEHSDRVAFLRKYNISNINVYFDLYLKHDLSMGKFIYYHMDGRWITIEIIFGDIVELTYDSLFEYIKKSLIDKGSIFFKQRILNIRKQMNEEFLQERLAELGFADY